MGDTALPAYPTPQLRGIQPRVPTTVQGAKHKLLPLARLWRGKARRRCSPAKLGELLLHKAFGLLAYVQLEHELNDSVVLCTML